MSELLRLRQQGLEWRVLDDELVALDAPSSTFFSTNRAGRTLWPSLARGATREQLAALLVDRFGIDPQAAARDVDAFLAALDERGLLAREP